MHTGLDFTTAWKLLEAADNDYGVLVKALQDSKDRGSISLKEALSLVKTAAQEKRKQKKAS